MREFSGTWMRHSGDFWGGFAAMLVALPASVAFGVTVYAAINPHYAAFGALAGILGAAALGLLNEEEFDRLVRPEAMIGSVAPVGDKTGQGEN